MFEQGGLLQLQNYLTSAMADPEMQNQDEESAARHFTQTELNLKAWIGS